MEWESGRGWGGWGEEQGWRTGDSTRIPPMWPAFKSRRGCHMWVEFAVCSLVGSERIFRGRYSIFPLSSKLSSNTHLTSKERMWLKFPGIFSPKRQNLKKFRNRKFWKFTLTKSNRTEICGKNTSRIWVCLTTFSTFFGNYGKPEKYCSINEMYFLEFQTGIIG